MFEYPSFCTIFRYKDDTEYASGVFRRSVMHRILVGDKENGEPRKLYHTYKLGRNVGYLYSWLWFKRVRDYSPSDILKAITAESKRILDNQL